MPSYGATATPAKTATSHENFVDPQHLILGLTSIWAVRSGNLNSFFEKTSPIRVAFSDFLQVNTQTLQGRDPEGSGDRARREFVKQDRWKCGFSDRNFLSEFIPICSLED
jgi:hypothetical protein